MVTGKPLIIRLTVLGLVLLAAVSVVMALRHHGIEGAAFDRDAGAPARAGASSAGGFSSEGVLWLIAATLSAATALAVAVLR